MAGRDHAQGPRHFQAGIEAVLSDVSPSAAPVVGTVFSRWTEIVGPAVAEHVQPVRIRDGALVVVVDHPVWATQMRTLATAVLDEVAHVTNQRLERLEVTVKQP
jgi:predicted nucleic acid-binding Zn ribbon protein